MIARVLLGIAVAAVLHGQQLRPADDIRKVSGQYQQNPFGTEARGRELERAAEHSAAPRHSGATAAAESRMMGGATAPTANAAEPAPPPAVLAEQRLTEKFLAAAMRAILLLALIGIGARMLPEKMMKEIVDGGNTALAAILAAAVVALGLVLALQ